MVNLGRSLKKTIDEVVGQLRRDLMFQLQTQFTAVPQQVCRCGKPVVFEYPKKTFKCTRCGRKWELVVDVREKVLRGKSMKE